MSLLGPFQLNILWIYVVMASLVVIYHLILWSCDIVYESHFHMGLICLLTPFCCHLSEKAYYFCGYSESWHSGVFYGKTNKKESHPVKLPRVYLLSFSLGVPPNWRKTSLQSSKENKQTMSYSLLRL